MPRKSNVKKSNVKKSHVKISPKTSPKTILEESIEIKSPNKQQINEYIYNNL
jgi:hypothetical protein